MYGPRHVDWNGLFNAGWRHWPINRMHRQEEDAIGVKIIGGGNEKRR